MAVRCATSLSLAAMRLARSNASYATGTPAGSVPKELTYDLWLDENDLMRRVQYTMAGGGVTISMSDWGEPVPVKAPAKADIMEMPGS